MAGFGIERIGNYDVRNLGGGKYSIALNNGNIGARIGTEADVQALRDKYNRKMDTFEKEGQTNPIENTEPEPKKKRTGLKVALAALLVTGVYLLTKGKVKLGEKAVEGMEKTAEKVAGEAGKVAKKTEKVAEEVGKSATHATEKTAEELERLAKEVEQKAKAEAERLVNEPRIKVEQEAKVEAEKLAKQNAEQEIKPIKTSVSQVEADRIVENLDEKQLSEIGEFLNKSESTEYNHEIIRHATSSENAELIKTQGYDISHAARNNGSNNFKGMDVEVLRIGDLGKRYGTTKLEYDFSGKALNLTNEQSDAFYQLVNHVESATGDTVMSKAMHVAMENPKVYMGDVQTGVVRSILRKFGYDAIAVTENGKTLFLTILEPNNTKGLKYLRTFSV